MSELVADHIRRLRAVAEDHTPGSCQWCAIDRAVHYLERLSSEHAPLVDAMARVGESYANAAIENLQDAVSALLRPDDSAEYQQGVLDVLKILDAAMTVHEPAQVVE